MTRNRRIALASTIEASGGYYYPGWGRITNIAVSDDDKDLIVRALRGEEDPPLTDNPAV